MENKLIKFSKLDYYEGFIALIFVILFTFGGVLHFLPSTRSFAITLTESFLLVTNLLVTISILWNAFVNKKITSNIFWIIVCYIITLGLEVAGVMTGKIFGEYTYGSVFDWKIFDVPLIIGWNWVIVIASATILAKQIYIQFLVKLIIYTKNKDRIVKLLKSPVAQYVQNVEIAFLASIIAVLVDYVLEPIAIKFDYWRWPSDIVPLQNYLSWMAIAFIFSLISMWFKTELKSKLAVFFLFLQVIFFIFLSII